MTKEDKEDLLIHLLAFSIALSFMGAWIGLGVIIN